LLTVASVFPRRTAENLEAIENGGEEKRPSDGFCRFGLVRMVHKLDKVFSQQAFKDYAKGQSGAVLVDLGEKASGSRGGNDAGGKIWVEVSRQLSGGQQERVITKPATLPAAPLHMWNTSKTACQSKII
jgi:hypothetical protein